MKPRRHARERWTKPWLQHFGPEFVVRLRRGRWFVWARPVAPIVTEFRFSWGAPTEHYTFDSEPTDV